MNLPEASAFDVNSGISASFLRSISELSLLGTTKNNTPVTVIAVANRNTVNNEKTRRIIKSFLSFFITNLKISKLFLLSHTFFANSVEHGARIIDGKAVMLENVPIYAVKIRT